MAKPVTCCIVDLPDGRFAVVAALGPGKVFRREGLLTLAEAEASVDVLAGLMAACGVQVIRTENAFPAHGSFTRPRRHARFD